MAPSTKASIAPLLNGLAERIAQRDLPPVQPHVDPNDPAQFMNRLLAALRPLTPHRNQRGRLVQAQMLYQFLVHPTQTAADLAGAAGVERVAGSTAHTGLVRAGLLYGTQEGPRRVYRLTRWGEDWLLAIGRAEVPPGND